ncbi:MAG: 1-acyl-sn-glycerol-3-phosphate acyltransferase [Muribaculaceae bacterium]|nr:1-acyl-sn-glycerol-3-phosphate acyltransferase [Muribaculaceae bacterium]
MKIDLTKIIRQRAGGWKGKMIPGFLLHGLERLIHQDELNHVLEATYPKQGTAFAKGVYDFFDLTLTTEGMENIPDDGRFIFASNHPLGGLDGIGLISILGEKYGDANISFLVNDMLMNVEPLRPVFLPINKYGAQGRDAARAINDAYASDRQIIIFPAGLCSRLGDDGVIRDLRWNKSFIAKAIEFKRDIIPVHFIGENSPRFYKTARRRKKLGLKINIEQALLPGELCKSRGKSFHVIFGKPISWQTLADSPHTPTLLASELRSTVYALNVSEIKKFN